MISFLLQAVGLLVLIGAGFLAAPAAGQISGFGPQSYVLGVDAALHLLARRGASPRARARRPASRPAR